MFSTDFIFRQQENLVDTQKCQAEFRSLCNKILLMGSFLKYFQKGLQFEAFIMMIEMRYKSLLVSKLHPPGLIWGEQWQYGNNYKPCRAQPNISKITCAIVSIIFFVFFSHRSFHNTYGTTPFKYWVIWRRSRNTFQGNQSIITVVKVSLSVFSKNKISHSIRFHPIVKQSESGGRT